MKLKGFTMIEILIVIAIIGLLLGIVLPNMSAVKTRSRDEDLVAKLAVIEQALGKYREKCGAYPMHSPGDVLKPSKNNGATTGNPNTATCPEGITFGSFLPPDYVNTATDTLVIGNLIKYQALVRPGQNTNRCTSYHLGVQLSSASATPIQRAATRGWTWPASLADMQWNLCQGGVLSNFNNTYYEAITPTGF